MLALLVAAAAAPQRSTHDLLYGAIIAAASAIVGGIIGGSIPGYFMLKAEDKRHAHAMEMERRAVIGTARALNEFFARVETLYTTALENGRWWGDELDAKVQPPSLEDQKAVLGQLTSYEAGAIAASMRLIEFVRAHREISRSHSENLSPTNKTQLESGRPIVQEAATFLRRVAELPTPSVTES